jgi:hypothetical protein
MCLLASFTKPWLKVVVVLQVLLCQREILAFLPQNPTHCKGTLFLSSDDGSSATVATKEENVKINDLLSDLPTPTLLVELSLAASALNQSSCQSLDDFLNNADQLRARSVLLDGSLFVHTQITDTSERDKINLKSGSGKSLIIGQVDCPPQFIPGSAYLGIGLANHHVGGYYWARGMGMGASLPAHGVEYRGSSTSSSMGELYWKKRGPGLDARETTEESSNSNDGKRSEWADFLTVGGTVQLVPYNTTAMLIESPFQRLIGVRRIGRPLGADPIVERMWMRDDSNGCWVLVA